MGLLSRSSHLSRASACSETERIESATMVMKDLENILVFSQTLLKNGCSVEEMINLRRLGLEGEWLLGSVA